MNEFFIIFQVIAVVIFVYIVSSIFRTLYNFFRKDIIKKKAIINTFGYELIYTDQKNVKRKEDVIYSKMLTSEKHGLRGKPDFIYRNIYDGLIMPVELKSGFIGENSVPYEGDLMQLVAYFVILEDYFGIKPKKGKLIYADYMFIVKNTKEIRKRVVSILYEMRDMIKSGEGEALPSFVKCRNCVCNNTVCQYCQETSN